jgi:hypothetical protein
VGKLTERRRQKATTQYLHVPLRDWPAITSGRKTEFRTTGHNVTLHHTLHAPGPVVCWSAREHVREQQFALMVLEAAWSEPLGAISPESLRREGFASVAEFRTYWRERHIGRGTPYKPLSIVQVYQVRPWRVTDHEEMAGALLDRLYGPWLNGNGHAE